MFIKIPKLSSKWKQKSRAPRYHQQENNSFINIVGRKAGTASMYGANTAVNPTCNTHLVKVMCMQRYNHTGCLTSTVCQTLKAAILIHINNTHCWMTRAVKWNTEAIKPAILYTLYSHHPKTCLLGYPWIWELNATAPGAKSGCHSHNSIPSAS